MIDRNVLQLEPQLNADKTIKPFSSFRDHANIVLLGDPGAGKTHLFHETAQSEGARFLRARDFLNLPKQAFESGDCLFIDGLDEKRAGRGDQGTIDCMVQKLFEIAPSKVRLSCREQDWLGATDLAAFQPYFERHGGVHVISLRRLSQNEQKAVLLANNFNETDAETFVSEALSRGLGDYLGNPQSLLMLIRAVQQGTWPATRKDLFETSANILLSEHSVEHSRCGAGVYCSNELKPAAGAACAIRLISDVSAIGLSETTSNPDRPSYRSLAFLDADKVLAALTRRVFTAGPDESVDYIHRTTAEYLAAAWLGDQIRSGLPLGRLRSLIGVDNHPAPELRGVHAWLAIALPPDSANLLIEADPYGVLAYGDAASLSPSCRLQLLDALGRLAARDPWFRARESETISIGSLVQPDMVAALGDILRSDPVNPGLLSIVTDALAIGAPLLELKADLFALFVSCNVAYAVRSAALTALIRMGEDSKELIVQGYRQNLTTDEMSIRLRAIILARFYAAPFNAEDVTSLLNDVLHASGEGGIGSLWPLKKKLPINDISDVLNRLIQEDWGSNLERRNSWEVAHFCEHLVVRLLQEPDIRLEPTSLLGWIQALHKLRPIRGDPDASDLKSILSRRTDLMRSLIEAWLDGLEGSANDCRRAYHEVYPSFDKALDFDLLIEWLYVYLLRTEEASPKEEFIIELALAIAFHGTERGRHIFEKIYAFGGIRPHLQTLFDRILSNPIPEWRLTESLENAAERQSDEEATRTLRLQIETDLAVIRAGGARQALAWASQVYFCLYQDCDEILSPQERLVLILGDENTEGILEGFRALLTLPDIPTLEEIVRVHADQQVFNWWYGLLAGMDERWTRDHHFDDLSDAVITSVLAVDEAFPTFTSVESPAKQLRSEWKTALIDQRPDLARDAYMALATADLKRAEGQNKAVSGLHALLSDPHFEAFRAEITLHLLQEFPNAPLIYLERLLLCGLSSSLDRQLMLETVQRVLENATGLTPDQHDVWLATAYCLSPQEFETALQNTIANRKEIVWRLRDMSYHGQDDPSPIVGLSTNQLEFLAWLIGSHFPQTPHPNRGWEGNQNTWDASDFVRQLISKISAQTSDRASEALSRLVANEGLRSYREHTLHALANQQALKRDADYERPNWAETVQALTNGAPVNVRDLHALIVEHLCSIREQIAASNTDIFKRFWNENPYGQIDKPKSEESCRDVLVDLLRDKLSPLGVLIEPEGHMAADKRADISVSMVGRKVLCELKRDYHSEVWQAATTQLDRFYTIDPDAKGLGVYLVFWFGDKRTRAIAKGPSNQNTPQSAAQMEEMIRNCMPTESQTRLAVIVVDVTGTTEACP